MKRLALLLLALSSTGAAAPSFVVVNATKPAQMCKLDNGAEISCAYLAALFQKMRDEQRPMERAI